MKKRIWVLEILIIISIAFVVARHIWVNEFIQFEDSLIKFLGFDSSAKYVITVPIAVLLYYRLYKREELNAKSKGQKVISLPVIVFAIISLVLAVCFIVLG